MNRQVRCQCHQSLLRFAAQGLAASLLASGTMTGAAGAQRAPVITGTVRAADTREPLAYSGVLVVSTTREQLTNADGTFAFHELSAGRITIRVRHIGFVPRDTTLSIQPGDSVTLEITLARVAIRLDAMRVVRSRQIRMGHGCPAASDSAEGESINELLGQIIQNAEQYRLLVRSHPFSLHFAQRFIVRYRDGRVATEEAQFPGFGSGPGHFVLIASDKPVYRAGQVFRTVHGASEVFVPEIQDFADQDFLDKHCFTYEGDTTIDAAHLVRVGFTPVGDLGSPDIEGVVFVRAESFSIAAVDMQTTGVPEKSAASFSRVRVLTRFAEIRPGIAVLSHLESYLFPGLVRSAVDSAVVSRGETQDLDGVRWKSGAP